MAIRNVTNSSIPSLPSIPGGLLGWMATIVVVATIFTSFAMINADEVGIVTRFGKYNDPPRPPGLMWKLPFGIDRVIKIPVERQLKLEFGFGTYGGNNPNQYSIDPSERENEQNMVTGDLNMTTVQWVIQYRIQNAKQYLFNVRAPAETLRDASESVMREAVGDRAVDEVLTVGRQKIEETALKRLMELSERYGLGVSIMQVQLIDVNPPNPVQASFNEVNKAQQEREESINKARGEYNKAIPRARGQAQQKIQEAEGYALLRVNEAKGDAQRFNDMLAAFIKAPEVTRRRLYLETMSKLMPKLDKKIVLDEDAKGVLPLLQLNSEGEKK